MRRVGHDLRPAHPVDVAAPAPGIIATAAVAITVRGHSALTRDAVGAELLGHARARTCSCRTSPSCRRRAARTTSASHVERRRQREDVRIAPGAADSFRCGRHACEHRNVPRTLTPNIRSKRFIGVASVPVRLIALALLTRMSMPPKRSTVAVDRGVRPAPRRGCRRRSASAWPPALLDLRGRGVDRAGKLRVRLDGLRGDGDVGAVARGAQRDREADAARAAGDEQRLALEIAAVSRSAVSDARTRGGRLARNAVMPSTKSASAAHSPKLTRLGLQLLGQRAPQRLADEALAVARALARGPPRWRRTIRERRRVEVGARHDAIDDPERAAPRAASKRSPSSRISIALRGRRRGAAAHHVPPPSGVSPMLPVRRREIRVVGGNRQVACVQQRQPEAGDRAVHARDDRLRHPLRFSIAACRRAIDDA